MKKKADDSVVKLDSASDWTVLHKVSSWFGISWYYGEPGTNGGDQVQVDRSAEWLPLHKHMSQLRTGSSQDTTQQGPGSPRDGRWFERWVKKVGRPCVNRGGVQVTIYHTLEDGREEQPAGGISDPEELMSPLGLNTCKIFHVRGETFPGHQL